MGVCDDIFENKNKNIFVCFFANLFLPVAASRRSKCDHVMYSQFHKTTENEVRILLVKYIFALTALFVELVIICNQSDDYRHENQ